MSQNLPAPVDAHVVAGAELKPFVPRTLEGVFQICDLLGGSNCIPKGMTKSDAAVAIMAGAEVGFRPLQALQSICVINGRPSIFGDGALALVEAFGDMTDMIEEEIDDPKEGRMAVCTITRRGRKSPIKASFSEADQKTAKLDQKDLHKLYPKRMRKMRARSFALRDAFPHLLKGLAIVEEIEDIGPARVSKAPIESFPRSNADDAEVTAEYREVEGDDGTPSTSPSPEKKTSPKATEAKPSGGIKADKGKKAEPAKPSPEPDPAPESEDEDDASYHIDDDGEGDVAEEVDTLAKFRMELENCDELHETMTVYKKYESQFNSMSEDQRKASEEVYKEIRLGLLTKLLNDYGEEMEATADADEATAVRDRMQKMLEGVIGAKTRDRINKICEDRIAALDPGEDAGAEAPAEPTTKDEYKALVETKIEKAIDRKLLLNWWNDTEHLRKDLGFTAPEKRAMYEAVQKKLSDLRPADKK